GIKAGLPGSNALIATADSTAYAWRAQIKWSSSTWATTGNLAMLNLQTAAPFRCAAPKVLLAPNPNTIPNQFVTAQSPYKSETADTAMQAWATAHDTCFLRGGHLARAAELAELIEQGLPNGSATNIWTSDEAGYNGTQFLAEVLNWTALDQRFSFQYTG